MPPEFALEETCEPRFQPVAEAFRANFTAGKECGASLAVIHAGRLVLDMWAGHVDPAGTRPWHADTLVPVFSTTKMVAALTVLLLADRGKLDLDAPLAAYWPEFASHGKDTILVRHVLSHTAGLPAFTSPVTFPDMYDWERIIRLLEAQKPLWKPGTKLGYHTLTYGFLLGELVRRVSGQSLGQFLRQELTAPLGIDFWIGLPELEEPRTAQVVPARQILPPLLVALVKLLFPLGYRNLTNPLLESASFNDPRTHRAEIPAGNGMGNARSVAQLGAILAGGGSYNGQQVLSRSIVERAITPHSHGRDGIAFGRPTTWGLGVILSNKALLLGPRSFYATGLGGSVCVMDLDHQVTLAYVMNKMAELSEGDSRSIPLVESLWQCLS